MVVGPTASGKSALALAVAGAVPGAEIVSVDSMAVYREMDIATAKPSPLERQRVPHHLLDVVDPAEEYGVARYQHDVHSVLDQIAARGARPILVGGTGLYLRAALDDLQIPGQWPELAAELREEASRAGGLARLHGRLAVLDPLAAARMEPTNARRVVRALEVTLGAGRPFSSFGAGLREYPPSQAVMVGLSPERDLLDRRIAQRLERWMADGLLEEVRSLARRSGGLSRTARQALAYRELLAHVEHGVALAEALQGAERRTRLLARRQWSWFRRDPRIIWLDPTEDLVAQVLGAWEVEAAAEWGSTSTVARSVTAQRCVGVVAGAGAGPGSGLRGR